jgi:hypothetical protein
MSLLQDVKRVVEKVTGSRRPADPQALLRDRKPVRYRFKDDGLIPNHPKWPLVIYKSAVRLPDSLDPPRFLKNCSKAAVGATPGATVSTTTFTIIRVSMKRSASPAAAPRCNSVDQKDAS